MFVRVWRRGGVGSGTRPVVRGVAPKRPPSCRSSQRRRPAAGCPHGPVWRAGRPGVVKGGRGRPAGGTATARRGDRIARRFRGGRQREPRRREPGLRTRDGEPRGAGAAVNAVTLIRSALRAATSNRRYFG